MRCTDRSKRSRDRPARDARAPPVLEVLEHAYGHGGRGRHAEHPGAGARAPAPADPPPPSTVQRQTAPAGECIGEETQPNTWRSASE